MLVHALFEYIPYGMVRLPGRRDLYLHDLDIRFLDFGADPTSDPPQGLRHTSSRIQNWGF